MSSSKKYKYSETFFSAQGEGKYTGVPSLWIRFFLCNLQCDGFGQEDPTDPSTYELPYKELDVSGIERVEDLPVFDKGCDSSYTWAKKYRHLMRDKTISEIADELESLLPGGKFKHPVTGVWNHMVFTGGEPMLNQQAMYELLDEFRQRDNMPRYVTIETNGTVPLTEYGVKAIRMIISQWNPGGEWFWSISPKLWSVAGEKPDKAICPDVIQDYSIKSQDGQLKFVVDGSERAWSEVDHAINQIRCSNFEKWVMGIGGTYEGLIVKEADIADQAIQRGYNYSTRAHVHIYGNAIGK